MVDYGAETIHVDVMDGAFVPNLTLGAPIVKSLRKFVGPKPFLDCHLMVANPEQWIEDFKSAGASGYTVHVETFGTRCLLRAPSSLFCSRTHFASPTHHLFV